MSYHGIASIKQDDLVITESAIIDLNLSYDAITKSGREGLIEIPDDDLVEAMLHLKLNQDYTLTREDGPSYLIKIMETPDLSHWKAVPFHLQRDLP